MTKGDVHIDKETLRRPDAFLQTMATSWSALERHRHLFLGAIGVVLMGAIAFLVWDFSQRRSEQKAADALYEFEATYFKTKEGFERAKYEAMAPVPPSEKSDEKKAEPASGDLQKDYGPVVEGFESVVNRFPGAKAGAQAAIWLGEIYLEYKQPEKASAALAKVADHQKPGDLIFAVTNLVYGNALASKGDCSQAIERWQKIVSRPENAFLHPEALLKSGICYESLHQADRATEMYRKVTENHPETGAAQSAKTYLRAMESKAASTPSAKAG